MARVRARKETGKLYLDFHYLGLRCREQTELNDNKTNHAKLERLLRNIQAQIANGSFNYESVFPYSKNLLRIKALEKSQGEYIANIEVQSGILEKKVTTPLFAEFAEQWLKEFSIEWRDSHTANVESILSSSIFPYFGKLRLHTITKDQLLDFRVKEARKKGRDGNKTMSPKTVNARMGIVKQIMEEESDRYNFDNPYRNIKPLKLQRTHIEPFSMAEVNTIINSVRADFRNYYIVRFFSGMRTGEIDGLKWEYIDFKRRQILVRETIVRGKTEYTKTDGSQREIPMLGPVYDALKEQYEATGKLSPYVFCNGAGQHLDHNNVTKRVWYPLLRYLNLTKRKPYQTRHTAATLLLASGENPEWVAHILGHSSTEMLFKVYSRYIPNATRQDGSAFDRLLQQQEVQYASV